MLATDDVAAALRWFDPVRETQRARARAQALLENGRTIRCVWSDERLNERTLDIDHCLPRSAWPCGDLWNLLPAHRKVNQRLKRDQIVSADVFRKSRGPITRWWQDAYLGDSGSIFPAQFWREAHGTLPLLSAQDQDESSIDDLFSAVDLHRMRLRNDRQLSEWDGFGHV